MSDNMPNKYIKPESKIIIFSAPSGSGKKTIANTILQKGLNL